VVDGTNRHRNCRSVGLTGSGGESRHALDHCFAVVGSAEVVGSSSCIL
jgi:hypothetical protein